ncbi:MAG: hypothetical protein Q9214_003616 [Letrouitia sp. 1 TL-2023]
MAPISTQNLQQDDPSPSKIKFSLDNCQEQSRKFNPVVDQSQYRIFHQVLRHRAADPYQVPLIAFPRSTQADYEYYTGAMLYRFADCAASMYEEKGLKTNDSLTVAILGPTNIDWVVSTFALSMAGYSVLTLSPRLSSAAIAKLLQETNCECLVYSNTPPIIGLVQETAAAVSVQTVSMHSRTEYDCPERPLRQFPDDPTQENRPAIIMHSSGSTGLPKSMKVPHWRFTNASRIVDEDRYLITLPLSHAFGLYATPPCMYHRKTVHFLNPDLPTTCEGLIQAIAAAKPGLLGVVPYILKLLNEEERGIEALRGCAHVLTGGSQCPDDLGDHLVDLGVNLSTLFGSTECSTIGASINRSKDDKAWNYIRIPDNGMEQIFLKPVAENMYEFVFLKDYPGRIVANSDDPPESFHSRDIFTPHPTVPSAWKYVTRMDDRVTLLNGEKVLPLPIEGCIRKHPAVREAVVVGIGKTAPGILLFRADNAKELSDNDFVEETWSVIEEANKDAESFSQISRDVIIPMPAGIDIPHTDKQSVIRAQVYKVFEKDIESMYSSLEDQQEGTAILEGHALVDYLLGLGQGILGKHLTNPDDDFFNLGMNSLQAIQMRAAVLKNLSLGGNSQKKLSQNVIFEQGNISNLAEHLTALRLGTTTVKEKPIALIEEMTANFSVTPQPRERIPKKNVIVLTGATGGLGAQLLAQLANHPRTSHIYCLLRGQNAAARLEHSLKERHYLTLPPIEIYTVLTSSLHEPNLGLSEENYAILKARTTHIIHSAWPVNFQLGLPSFSSSLQGLQNLLTLSLTTTSSSQPARLVFCSSIAVALDTPPPAKIPEAPIVDLSHVSGIGYGASKLVGERIIEAANRDAGANASVVRIGQIVGDRQAGVWNDTEMVPLMIRSALTMGILPKLGGERCCWLPVDICASAITEIEGLDKSAAANPEADLKGERESKRLLYNLASPLWFSWNEDLLPALKKLGLHFEAVTFPTWIAQLRKLASQTVTVESELMKATDRGESDFGDINNDLTHATNGDNNDHHPADLTTTVAAADPEQNPALKLIDFFEESYAHEPQGGGITFAIEEAEKASPSLRNMEPVIESGLLEKMLSVWMGKWKGDELVKGR